MKKKEIDSGRNLSRLTNAFNVTSATRKYIRQKSVILLITLSALCASLLNCNPLWQFDRNAFFSSHKKNDLSIKRALVTALPNGDCRWVEGKDVDQDPNFELFSTAIVAFPGAGKRILFLQLEALTELTTRDDFWLETHTNVTRYAFFKTQYPHHEGIWSWGDQCSQSVYLLTNPRMALITYLFILHEIRYAKDWETAYSNLDRVFTIRSPITDWETWRNQRVSAEIHWWSWHIDYWMEGGLLRDIFTHELTTPEHWHRLMAPSVYSEAEARAFQSSLTNVQPTYDTHCTGGEIQDCRPTVIASYERMMNPSTGPQEVAKFTAVIEGKVGIEFIEETTRQCAWEKIVIANGSGRRDTRDREGPALQEYDFTPEQEQSMMVELERIRDKYSALEWRSNQVAKDLVGYMEEYIAVYKANPQAVY